MTVAEALRGAPAGASSRRRDRPRSDAALLLEHVTGRDARSVHHATTARVLTAAERAAFDGRRRAPR